MTDSDALGQKIRREMEQTVADYEAGERPKNVLYRCYCEDCEWDTTVLGQHAAAGALFGHGLATGHSETSREERSDQERGCNA